MLRALQSGFDQCLDVGAELDDHAVAPADDHAVSPADDLDAAEVAAEPGRRNCILGRRLQTKLEKATACVKRFLSISNPSLQNAVSSRILGTHAATTASISTSTATPICDPTITIPIDNSTQNASMKARGLSSHVRSVRKNLKSKLRGGRYLVLCETSDEASMWVRRQADDVEIEMRKRRVAATKAKGKKVVLNKRESTKKSTNTMHKHNLYSNFKTSWTSGFLQIDIANSSYAKGELGDLFEVQETVELVLRGAGRRTASRCGRS